VKDVPIFPQGLPAVLFIRRFCGGLVGLSAGNVADLPPNSH